MTSIQPIYWPNIPANYPKPCTPHVTSEDVAPGYADATLQDIKIQQAELKVKILEDKLNAYDTTKGQKMVIQAMLNDARRELGFFKVSQRIY